MELVDDPPAYLLERGTPTSTATKTDTRNKTDTKTSTTKTKTDTSLSASHIAKKKLAYGEGRSSSTCATSLSCHLLE